MVSSKIIITHESGVHARPAAMFVKLANRFPCEIHVEKDGARINGKSIMGLMMLALTHGTEITIQAEGDKEKEALQALAELIGGNFQRTDLL